MTSHIRITDDQGRVVFDRPEPAPASVVLTDGPLGNAYQRYASDGLWHRGKAAVTWGWLLTQRNLVLVYSAPNQVTEPICRMGTNGNPCTEHEVHTLAGETL